MARTRLGSAMGAVVLPAAVFQIVLVGPGFATARGYTWLAYGFLAAFVLPLLTRGIYLIRKSGRPALPREARAAESRSALDG